MHPAIPTTRRRRASGFTLIEIMAVIVIIGLLLGIAAPQVYNKVREARVTTTKAKINNLKGPIGDYRNHFGRVPDSLEVLLEPSEKNFGDPYIPEREGIRDAWGNEFVYHKVSNSKYEVISLGADGIEGGDADDADISSNKLFDD